MIVLPLLFVLPATATEMTWDGHYRARGQFFDSLSLSNTNASAEGWANTFDHRLRLQPGWLLSDKVSLHVQMDLLSGVNWGDEPVLPVNPITGDEGSVASSEAVASPTTDDGGATLQNLSVTRAWGEVDIGIGRLRFGRMPVEWGTGMVFNAGNDPLDEYGDTSDRIQLISQTGDVYLLTAWENRSEGLLGEPDDLTGLAAAVVYQREQAGLGTYHSYSWMGQDEARWSTYIADLWASADMGAAHIEAEFAAVFGGGDLDTGANDIQLGQYGANIGLSYQGEKLSLGLGAGAATGDVEPDDARLRTFSFDRDFNVGLVLFEEIIPILETTVMNDTNGGRTAEATRTGEGISNAVYLQPRVGWALREDLVTELSVLLAQQAKVPLDTESGKGYGPEIDLSVAYRPFAHFATQATAGLFFPGKYFSEWEHDELGGDFDRPVFAMRLLGTVSF